MNSDRYNKLSAFLRGKFGGRVEKICVDGGFSCPNRGGFAGSGGCLFCCHKAVERSADDITAQVRGQLDRPAKNGADKFIVYFQNGTNTYADVRELKAKYDAALIDDRICALAIATRPDCLPGEVVDLIASYASKYYVWVELGLQTANDAAARLINRGYDSCEFTAAAEKLSARGIDVAAHLILGLPGETDADIDRTVDFINKSNISGIKLHSLYITKDTPLYQMYQAGAYIPQSFGDYIRRLTRVVTRLRPDIVIHRITGDAPRGELIAPAWNNRKKLIRNAFENALETNDWHQGCACEHI